MFSAASVLAATYFAGAHCSICIKQCLFFAASRHEEAFKTVQHRCDILKIVSDIRYESVSHE